MTTPVRPPVKKKGAAGSAQERAGHPAVGVRAVVHPGGAAGRLGVAGGVRRAEQVLENYVPIGTAAPSEVELSRPDGAGPRRPARRRHPDGTRDLPAALIEEPEPEPEPDRAPDAEIEPTDSAAGTALFGNETLSRVTVERCIAVTYTGSADVDPRCSSTRRRSAGTRPIST